MKIRLVGAELLHAHGQMVGQMNRHGEANSRFSRFRQRAPKKSLWIFRKKAILN